MEELEEKLQIENIGNANALQFGVYRIKKGNNTGKIIMAYRGTATVNGVVPDLGLIHPKTWELGGIMVTVLIDTAVQRANEIDPD